MTFPAVLGADESRRNAEELVAAAIDSNTLWLGRRRNRELDDRLRVLESWGPMPIQPLLARAELDASVRNRIAGVLLGLHEDPARRASLEAFGVRRFTAVDEASYLAARPLPAG